MCECAELQKRRAISLLESMDSRLKNRINKWRDGRAFGKHDKHTKEKHNDNNREKPEFLTRFEKAP